MKRTWRDAPGKRLLKMNRAGDKIIQPSKKLIIISLRQSRFGASLYILLAAVWSPAPCVLQAGSELLNDEPKPPSQIACEEAVLSRPSQRANIPHATEPGSICGSDH